jgi:hypothetical protein
MGERTALIRALLVLEDLYERAQRSSAPDDPPDVDLCRRYPYDDQLLWQVAFVNGLARIAADYEGRVFRNVHTLDGNLVENRDFDIDGEVVCKASRQSPCVLHFSGHTAQLCMDQWGGLLAAY